MADVFLSYSQKDRASVEKIAAGLKSLGLGVWYDARLESGDSFDEVIYTELHAAKAVLVCWSPDSMASKWPRSEAMIAYDKHKLAAAFLQVCELRPPFNLVQTSDLSDWNGEPAHVGWRAVVRGVGNLCGRPGVAALAEALAAGTQEAVADWAKQYPEEPLAAEIWESRRTHLRMEFATAFESARAELAAALEKRRSEADAALTRASQDFETWLDAERFGKSGPQPDPLEIVRQLMGAENAARPADRVEIGKLEAALAKADERAEAAIRDRDAAAAREKAAIAARDEIARRAANEAAAVGAQTKIAGAAVSEPAVDVPRPVAEPAVPGAPTARERRALRAGWFFIVAAGLPGFISDVAKADVSDSIMFVALAMWAVGAALLGIGIYAKRKRRPDRTAVLLRDIAVGALLVVAVPVFFNAVSKSDAGPLPYTLASFVVMAGTFGLALIGTSLAALARRRRPPAREPAPNMTLRQAEEEVSR